MIPYPGNPFQFLQRGIEHTGQRAEALYQGMGQGVHVTLGDGVEQQQLQHTVVRPALHAPGQKFGFDPASMPGVDGCHKLTSFCVLDSCFGCSRRLRTIT